MDPNIKLIRRIMAARHGGLAAADDEQILAVWNALLPADRERYLKEAGAIPPDKTKDPSKEKSHAVSTGPTTNDLDQPEVR